MARQGKGVSHGGGGTRGGGAKATPSRGVSTRAGKAGGMRGSGAKANSASPPPSDQIRKHGKVPGPPPVAGKGNFKKG
jgi:hypothetical protein